MLHCYNCGNDLPDNLIYCTRCGKRLDSPETPTQVMGGPPAAVTTPFQSGPTTPVITAKKRGGGVKVVVIALVGLLVLGAVVIVAGIMFWSFSKRQNNAVTVNANLAGNRTSSNVSNAAEVNVNAMSMNTNAIIDNAMKEIQKAANDALAAANKASNISIPTGKTLDEGTNRISFRPGAVSATSVGTVKEEASFVMRAKAGQILTGRITSPGGCIKFEDEDSSLTLQTEAGDNYLTVVNSCGKPTSMVLSVTIK